MKIKELIKKVRIDEKFRNAITQDGFSISDLQTRANYMQVYNLRKQGVLIMKRKTIFLYLPPNDIEITDYHNQIKNLSFLEAKQVLKKIKILKTISELRLSTKFEIYKKAGFSYVDSLKFIDELISDNKIEKRGVFYCLREENNEGRK